MAYGKWSASKSAKRDIAKKMQEIETFCAENGIERSRTSDSYYFTLKGCKMEKLFGRNTIRIRGKKM